MPRLGPLHNPRYNNPTIGKPRNTELSKQLIVHRLLALVVIHKKPFESAAEAAALYLQRHC